MPNRHAGRPSLLRTSTIITLAALLLCFKSPATAFRTRIVTRANRLSTMAAASKKPQITFVTGNAKKLEVRTYVAAGWTVSGLGLAWTIVM